MQGSISEIQETESYSELWRYKKSLHLQRLDYITQIVFSHYARKNRTHSTNCILERCCSKDSSHIFSIVSRFIQHDSGQLN